MRKWWWFCGAGGVCVPVAVWWLWTGIVVDKLTCVPMTELGVKIVDFLGQPRINTTVEVRLPSGVSQSFNTGITGRIYFSSPVSTPSLEIRATPPAATTVTRTVTCSPAPRFGYLTYHIYTLRVPAGQCSQVPAGVTGCVNTGDTLPIGTNLYYLFSVFDTGSSVVAINNSDRANGSWSDSRTLGLCPPHTRCQTFAGAQHDPNLLMNLNARIWGLSVVAADTSAPLDSPQVEVPALTAKPFDANDTLMGAPVAARTVAVIDYATTITRDFSFVNASGATVSYTMMAPDATFFPGPEALLVASGAPVPTYKFKLATIGSFNQPTQGGPSVGPRFLAPTAAFVHGSQRVTGMFLYDTGNAATQITEQVARNLGINLNSTPIDTITVHTPTSGDVTGKGYLIDKFEMTAVDGTNRFAVAPAIVYVRPAPADGSPTFIDNLDGVLGSNYFWGMKVKFDGPGSTLGLWALHP